MKIEINEIVIADDAGEKVATVKAFDDVAAEIMISIDLFTRKKWLDLSREIEKAINMMYPMENQDGE